MTIFTRFACKNCGRVQHGADCDDMTCDTCASCDWTPLAAEPMTIRIQTDVRGAPGKVADVELHFTEGPLAGLKLVGFTVWARRNGEHAVMFPARQYSVNGERRSFALLRPAGDAAGETRLRNQILDAYRSFSDSTRPSD